MGYLFILAALLVGSPLAFSASKSASYLDLDLRQDRFLGEVQHSAQESNFTQGILRVNLEPKRAQIFDYKVNARAQGAFESSEENYYGVPELYAGTNTTPVKVAVGRKKRKWSELDEYFHLGIWQPELRWDYLNPIQQGLTGAFLGFDTSRKAGFTLFMSAVNLPDQGPQYKLENGQFNSANRWFQQPSGALGLFQGTNYAGDAPLYFEIDRPSNEKLFFNPSLGLAFDYKGDSGFWTRAAYAYKPRNQIHLAIECTNCANLGSPVPLEVTAVIHPKIINHHVATLEAGLNRVDDRVWISLTGETPDRSDFPDAYEEAPLDDVLIAGLAYQHYAGNWLAGRPSWLQYSYLRVFEVGSKSRSGALKEDQVQSSLDRYPLKNLAAFDWKVRILQMAESRLNWNNRYWYSIPEQGGWLSSHLEYQVSALTWLIGADVLGSQVKPGSEQAGLFTRYRANDRVFGGISYVF
jgi:hypothetical protein